ncbi:MAG: hypothetical protein VX615_02730 [Planctomycetota bacterium]|nr:hypothetical protein [Planctomycetota bacterium]
MPNMLVELYEGKQKKGVFEVDIAQQPTTVIVEPSENELFLKWDSTIDDSKRIRGCVVCGGDLYKEQMFPQVTGIVIVLAFAGAVAGILGLVTTWMMLIAMSVVLVLDILILFVVKTRLSCYGCNTRFSHTTIAQYHKSWDPDKSAQLKRLSEEPDPKVH